MIESQIIIKFGEARGASDQVWVKLYITFFYFFYFIYYYCK